MTTLEQTIFDLVKPICLNHNIILVEVNYKTKPNNILEILIDKEEGITMDDAILVTDLVNPILDELDPIKEEYTLEVSSLGLERELKSFDEVIKSINKYVNIKLYSKILIDKYQVKEVEGIIKSVVDDILTIEVEIRNLKKLVTINKKDIAKIRLAIKF